MPAAYAQLVIEGDVPQFLCPVSGKPVFVADDGFTPGPGHSPYLRFFIDWAQEIHVATPEGLPEHQREQQRRLIEVCGRDDFDSQNDQVAALVSGLPSSALILEILDPPRGSFPGAICYIGFDFDRAAHEEGEASPVEMVSLDLLV